jgi:acyl-CoA synthetase (AMP-forming)/AMP-acid ligase II
VIVRSPFPDVEIPRSSFTDFILRRDDEHGDDPALVDAGTGAVTSYSQLRASVRAMAANLRRRGFEKGTVVAHYTANRPEYAIAFHGVSHAGGVNTTVNPTWTAGELAGQMRSSGAKYLLTEAAQLDKALAAAADSAVEEVFIYDDPAAGATPFVDLLDLGAAAPPPDVVIEPRSDLVALPYSSGTTGLPKGVMLTHRNLVANVCQCSHRQASSKSPAELRRERVIAVLPLFHIYGLTMVMNLTLYRGAALVTMPRFELAEFLRVMEEERITRAWLVPPIIQMLVKEPTVTDFDLSRLEFVNSGGAPLSAELEIACGERLGCRITQGYGMTEASPTTHWVTDLLAGSMPGKIGPPVPNTECRTVDTETGKDLPAGESGELLIRGPQVMKGYLDNPEATAETIDADGWLHTGDVALLEADGSLRIVDRIKELIKYNGYQVAPAELEAVLLTHPRIVDAAVVPIADADAGELPKAFVVTDSPLTEEEIVAYVAERVAPYKKLRAVELIDSVPRSPAGKILRRELVARPSGRSE